MSKQDSLLEEISMVTANFKDGLVFADILQDWFRFLGGKPGEVVVVDCGSDRETQTIYWDLFLECLIDKLQVIQSNHEDNYDGKNTGYIKNYTAWAISSKPYLLLFRIDTLPYRDGHDNWLEEAIGYLEQDDVFAISSSFTLPSKHHDAWPGWYFSHKCSHNFTLIKRSTLMAAVHEYAGDFVISGFKGVNPAKAEGLDARGVLEIALERYIQRHNVYTLCKIEDPTWTIFHTNTHGERLQKTREKYLSCQDINRYMNLGLSEKEPNFALIDNYHYTKISLVVVNFENRLVFADILQDWFKFLGGKPGEVVVVDGGSDIETQTVYWNLFQDGLIDKLQVIQSNHEDSDKAKCYIREYTAGAIASKPYVLSFKIDTLPYREGHDNWLEEALDYLERENVFAIGGSFNFASKHHDAWDGWYFSHKCSLNFSLMKYSTFMAAMHEFAGSYITSGFKGENPGQATGQPRHWVEVAFERYIQKHNVYTLCKIEDPTWTIFHTNTKAERLQKTREKYLARKDIKRYMNLGLSEQPPNFSLLPQYYYGQPPMNIIKKLRILFGQSSAGAYWQQLKRKLRFKN
jgi:hypothetical protein